MAKRSSKPDDRPTCVPEFFGFWAALCRDVNLTPTTLLRQLWPQFISLWKQRGGGEAVIANPEAFPWDRKVIALMRRDDLATSKGLDDLALDDILAASLPVEASDEATEAVGSDNEPTPDES